MTASSLEQQLVEAVANQRIEEVLDGLDAARLDDGDRVLVERLKECLTAIATERAARTDAAVFALQEAGIPAATIPFAGDDPVIPNVAIRVGPREATRAVETLESAGYGRDAPTDPGPWASYRRTLPAVRLVPTDDRPGCIEVRWKEGGGRPIHRLLHPVDSDWEAVTVPATLWPLYHLVHLVRLPLRVLGRRHRPSDLGPFLGTPAALIPRLLAFADVGSDDLLVDLGCGDGRVLVEAARTIGCRCRGVETDSDLVEAARRRAADEGVAGRVEIVLGDAATADVSDAQIVFLFLPIGTVAEILPALLDSLSPGARIVAHEVHAHPELVADREEILTAGHAITTARRWDPR